MVPSRTVFFLMRQYRVAIWCAIADYDHAAVFQANSITVNVTAPSCGDFVGVNDLRNRERIGDAIPVRRARARRQNDENKADDCEH